MRIDAKILIERAHAICRDKHGRGHGVTSRQVKALAEALVEAVNHQLEELEYELRRQIHHKD